MNAIETNHLTRAFGSLAAVDDLTLAIPEGTAQESFRRQALSFQA